jgi:hypothetical protein
MVKRHRPVTPEPEASHFPVRETEMAIDANVTPYKAEKNMRKLFRRAPRTPTYP